MERPNILLIMTDEERYPPSYEPDSVRSFRASQLTARESIRSRGLEFHRHYAGSTACVPSRATLFTGQYPSLHGVTSTDGTAKQNTDPGMHWLDPNSVPTLGDWFRAGGYRTHYRGKWHVSFADITIPGTHEGLKASDDTVPDVPEAPSQADPFTGRPACQEAFKAVWPQMIFETATDLGYRRLYYYLLKLVDKAIGRILEALDQSGMADETIVVFTSDHGDLLGAHGGLIQKWCNAFDEATRVPLLIAGPGIEPGRGGVDLPTSHVDLIPTLLGLCLLYTSP